ncbi:AbrB/MazE/SpoVT family DNA-binding domain-containing protein [Halohasta salina]|uniref:AbrB/MazE/SpoVT family DNA-binding domain-containing protein n=1 Tax=Halohasta salina TaxID=2961621 RepID=UPI0020A57DAE|nr:AbrB/MazE/SpoVT family DNA-binding domain-containing protein [Halohasta salina]
MSNDSEPDHEEHIVAVSKTARVMIPKPLREKHGISAPGEVAFVETQDGRMVVRPIGSMREFRGLQREGADDRPATAVLRKERNRDTQKLDELVDRFSE